MKKVIFLLALISSLFADEFLVKSFLKLENDLSARKYIKYDINGDACALIKVRTDINAVINFDSNTGIPIAPELKAKGEYWVYVVEGERALKCMADGFIPKTIPLESAGKISKLTVYELRLTSKSQDVKKYPVIILSKPEKAKKWIDGKLMGEEDSFFITGGKHNLLIKENGYIDYRKVIYVSANQLVFRDINLERLKPVDIHIISNPGGADVFIDGNLVGKTNNYLSVLGGMHDIKIKKNGYAMIEDEILVSENRVMAPIQYTLEKAVGVLKTKVSPEDAYVKIKNKMRVYRGNQQTEFPVGEYEYSVLCDKFNTISGIVHIQKNKTTILEANLVASTGNASVQIFPEETRCKLLKDNEIIKEFTHKYEFKDLPVGYYKIQCVCDGYRSKTLYLEIFANGKSRKKVILDKNLFPNSDMNKNKINDKEKDTLIKSTNGELAYHKSIYDKKVGTATLPVGQNIIDFRKNVSYEGIPEMVFVQGGTFTMGSNDGDDDEKPTHNVTLNDFYIGKCEVTQEQYEEIMGSNPSYFSGINYSVETVSWYNAVRFCNKLSEENGMQNVYTINGTTVTMDIGKNGYRLPTEAEWEYAARDGNASQGTTYSGSNSISDVAWYYDNSGSKTHAIGEKQPNELGLYDMSGNVWEWCWDWYGSSYYGSSASVNPMGPDAGSYRVLRGGSWSNYAGSCRVANRINSYPSFSSGNSIGFRITRSAP